MPAETLVITGTWSQDVEIIVMGSMWVDGGLQSNADPVGHRFSHECAGQEERYQIGVEQTKELRDDTLIAWDTTGLPPGNYALILQFYDTLGDTLEGYSPVRLEALRTGDGLLRGAVRLVSCQDGPELRFSFHLPAQGNATLSLYDVAGRRLAVPFSGLTGAEEHTVRYRPACPGLYVARLDTQAGTLSERVAFAK